MSTLGWIILFIYELITFSFSWALITFSMIIFCGTNLYGYFKCSKDQKSKMKGIAKKFISKNVSSAMNNAIQ